jgi:hypothetical protein
MDQHRHPAADDGGAPRGGRPVRFRVRIDGQAPGVAHGIDLDEQGNGTIIEPRLYQLIRQPEPIGDRELELEFLDPGAEVFSFTFGRAAGLADQCLVTAVAGNPEADFAARHHCSFWAARQRAPNPPPPSHGQSHEYET